MGIVNINDDSFSGDGTLDPVAALERAAGLVAQGADIIDVGGESARTNREAITEVEEVARVLPFIEGFRECLARGDWHPRDDDQLFPPLLSVNTWRPGVAAPLLAAGADILNDMGALPNADNAALAARHGAALLIMHSVGEPKIAHTHVRHLDVVADVERFFVEKLALAAEAGVDPESTILDPGIDFAKQCADNLSLLTRLDRLAELGRPLLLPISRKTVIGDVLGLPEPTTRDAGTIALLVDGLLRGASIFRVHNVAAAWQATRVVHALDAAACRPGGLFADEN